MGPEQADPGEPFWGDGPFQGQPGLAALLTEAKRVAFLSQMPTDSLAIHKRAKITWDCLRSNAHRLQTRPLVSSLSQP